MTPTSARSEGPPVDADPLSEFDALLASADVDDTEEDDLVQTLASSRTGRGWVIGSVLSAALGVVLVAAALVAASLSPRPDPDPTSYVAAELSGTTPRPDPRQTPYAAPSQQHERPLIDLVDENWVAELSDDTSIPVRALIAYAGASLVATSEYPACGLGWNTLAGIGHVESEHGTIHGSHLGADGVARPAIIGIPLTGETTEAIRDTDAGMLDGDAVWDRAVGPMQFIPTTWAQWGADGNGDGIRDPQNIDDSALAAARYLCDVGGDLTVADNWIAAIHAYNPTIEYNNRVADAAAYYAGRG